MTIVLPDTEQLVIQALLSMPELDDLGGRIYSVIPKARTFPLARVYRFGGDPLFEGDPYWLDAPSLQVDVWEDGTAQALRLGELLRACCAQGLPGVWPQGVVVSARVSSLVQSADSTMDPPKPRYRFTTTLIVHPGEGGPLSDQAAGQSPVEKEEGTWQD